MVIEIATFRPNIDEADFAALDARVQTDFVYQQRGCVRRTTARSPDGEWLVLTFWQSMMDAENAEKSGDPLWRDFRNAADGYTVSRFTSLD